ncbi:hypothetical protein LB558_24825 [Mesorhizobium sp. CO1-1-8]|nr:hypothetical protein [Mesorhizobium sp. CO1-1-8]MBZ9775739.1 hypothetical protein [Mesorhizobium sp. CO1-1-8]
MACALAACLKASKVTLRTPLHLALSYDEEIGCIGVRSLIDIVLFLFSFSRCRSKARWVRCTNYDFQ